MRKNSTPEQSLLHSLRFPAADLLDSAPEHKRKPTLIRGIYTNVQQDLRLKLVPVQIKNLSSEGHQKPKTDPLQFQT